MNSLKGGIIAASAIMTSIAATSASADSLILRGYVEAGPRVIFGQPGLVVPGYGRFPPAGYRLTPHRVAPGYPPVVHGELGPKAARARLRGMGFRQVRGVERHGRNYRAEAIYEGRPVEVVISSRHGRVLGIEPLPARDSRMRSAARQAAPAAPVRQARLLAAPLPAPRPETPRILAEPPRPRERDGWLLR